MNTQIRTHGGNQHTANALNAISAWKIGGNMYMSNMGMFEAVQILSEYCRTVGIFTTEEGTKWVEITTERDFNQ